MGWRCAIDGLLEEFKKINLKDGSFETPIDVKIVESKLRILTSETDRSLIEKGHLISVFPAIFLCVSSNDRNLRQCIARFLPSLKDLLDATSCNFSDWKDTINLEFVKLCEERLILIVEESSDDWIEPWLLLVNILFTDDEDESFADIALLNRLLSVVEKAFRAAKVRTEKFKTVFQTWERFCTFLTDSLSYKKFLTTVKRLKLLVLPFLSIKHIDADPYKHRAWFHVVQKIGLHSQMTVDEIVSPFLHFLIENRRMFIKYKEDVGNYLKILSQSPLVITKYYSEFIKCLTLAIEHDSPQEDITATWSFLCGYLSKMEYEYFKGLLHFLKSLSDNQEKKELTVELCLIAYQHKLFDFKSIYLEEIKSTCEDVFPLVITSLTFRENVFLKIMVEMLDMCDNLETEGDAEEEGCMSPILSMWELMIAVYFDFVDSSLDSRFNPGSVDVAIIRDLMILPLSQPLQDSSQEENSAASRLISFIKCLAKKMKSDIFSPDFLQKLGSGIQSSRISLDSCLWLASSTSELDREFNLIPLLSIISKSIASCGQPKAVIMFLNVLDKATEKTGLKINFKATLNYLKKFSSAYEPPYDQQIRIQAHSLLKRLPENVENKCSPINSNEPEEKKSHVRSTTFHSNFLSRLSKAEEKKNSKTVLAASIFPRNSDEAETNKENKQRTNEVHISPTSYRFAKSSAFILDNSESSESLQNDNFEAKVANFKVSTDFHKSPAKVIVNNRVEAGLSPNAGVINKLKPNATDSSPKINPVKDKVPNSDGKSPRNKYSFLDNNSLDTQDFVFVPPKDKESPLTKHQKEMMNKRREEIPALYQDLSQDTQITSESLACELSSLENNDVASEQNEDGVQTSVLLDNHKKEENITCVLEENAVFKNVDEKAVAKEESVKESKEDETEKGSVHKRLNFEGICGKMKQEVTIPLPRQSARRSASKYKHVLDPSTKNEPKASRKRKLEENPDDKLSNPCKRPAIEVDVSKNESTSLETNENSVQVKRRGRPKKVPEDGLKCNSESPEVSIQTSPVTTRRKRKSLTLNVDTEIVSLIDDEPDKDQLPDKCESVVLKENSNTLELNSDLVDSTVCDSETGVQTPCVKEVKIVLGKIEGSLKKDDVKENQLASSKCVAKENVGTPDLSTPTVQRSDETETKSTERSAPIINTPPTSETPNRRKKNKNPVKLNDFSPKMLRRGRALNKTSPKSENVTLKPVNSVNINAKNDDNESEFNKTLDPECKMVNESVNAMECDQIVDNGLKQTSEVVTEESKENPDGKVDSSQESSSSQILPKQDLAKDNKGGPTCKTSPTRTMRMLQMVANSGLKCSGNKTEANSSMNKSDGEEELSDTQNLSKVQKVVKYNSRASLIMQNVIDRNKTSESTLKQESKPIMTVDKQPSENDKNVTCQNNDNENDEEQSIGSCKRKPIMKSPQLDKKIKKDNVKLSGLNDISPGVKSKKSGLDNWLIKKDKNIVQEADSVIVKTSDDLIDISGDFDDVIVIDNCGDTTNSSNSELVSTSNGMKSESLLTDGDKTPEAYQSPPRWPKRWRKDKKPKDFIYSPLKRNKSPDNKANVRKGKQPKQMELSPSKPYSFVNWPKGDCETWVACEPTPTETYTASPILKWKTAYPSPTKAQISPNVTPKKRVSFLDPPVSKGLLYSKEELGGEVQHALLDKGTPIPSRRKKLIMGVQSIEKGEVTSTVKDSLESVSAAKSNENENMESLTDTTAISAEQNENSCSSIVIACEEEQLKTIDTSSTSNELLEVSSEPINHTEKVDVESMDVDNESMDVDSETYSEESTHADKSEQLTEDIDNDLRSMDVTESLIEESQVQEVEVDIVEKVVGKSSEDAAACIVEPVESSSSIPEVSSDDSTLNVDHEDISLIDDILLPSSEESKLDENDVEPSDDDQLSEVSESANVENDDVSLKPNSVLEHTIEVPPESIEDGFKEPEASNVDEQSIVEEQSNVENPEDVILASPLTEPPTSVQEKAIDENSPITIKEEYPDNCGEVSVQELPTVESRLNEDNLEISQGALDISSNSQPSLHSQIHSKCQEFNQFFQTIDVQQVSNNSLQDILSVISTMTNLAQKLTSHHP